jgi:CheY-like chemotaxis protein
MTKVLIVDDDEGFRETLSAVLTLEGFDVEVAANGREGLERLATSGPPNVVVLDLMMPVMSGWELIEAMRKDPQLAEIPAAVLSAARNPPDLPDSVAIFPKPFALVDLLKFLRATHP